MRGRRGRSIAAAAILLGPVALIGGRQTGQGPFRAGVEVITIAATVIDEDGRPVVNLPREAFAVYDDGVEQPITQFTAERVPIGVGLLIDASDSMHGQRIADARTAADTFLFELLDPGDDVFLLAFNHRPRVLTTWTRAPEVVRPRLDALEPLGGTALYDAILAGLPLIERRSRPRAALVVISDGADTASDATLKEVRSALLRSDAFVYTIAIDPPAGRPINVRVNPSALREITDQSGGSTEVVQDSADLVDALARIATELNSQYALGYDAPRAPDGRYHSIRVTVDRPGHVVRARRGYVATPRGVVRHDDGFGQRAVLRQPPTLTSYAVRRP